MDIAITIIIIIISALVLFSVIWPLVGLIFTTTCTFISRKKNLPPGPYQFPIIGNVLELGSSPHRSLARLSKKHGPLMSLKLGSISTVVVSSPGLARTVLQEHDSVFSSRKCPGAISAPEHDRYSVAWLPANNRWRKLRKLCKEQMFSASRLDSSQGLRREKMDQLYDYVSQSCETGRVVDIGRAAFITTLNLMSATLFSMEFANYNSDSSQEMKDAVWGVLRCIGAPNCADYFPILRRVDPQGILRESKFHFRKLMGIFDRIIDERLVIISSSRDKKKDEELKRHDLVEVLIEMNLKDENELSRQEINHLLMDLLVAGTDTSATTVEWAMSELLRNPKKMSKLRKEIDEAIGRSERVKESDIPRLPYLHAVVKETFRLHPPAPLLLPRKSDADVEINGYTIPKNTQILINVWASGRDHDVWSEADEFVPERCSIDGGGRSIDFRGRDFELIPFGAGRRMCPGLPLAHRMAHLMIATLVHGFEWELEGGMSPSDIDMSEEFGITLQKAVHLKAIPRRTQY